MTDAIASYMLSDNILFDGATPVYCRPCILYNNKIYLLSLFRAKHCIVTKQYTLLFRI